MYSNEHQLPSHITSYKRRKSFWRSSYLVKSLSPRQAITVELEGFKSFYHAILYSLSSSQCSQMKCTYCLCYNTVINNKDRYKFLLINSINLNSSSCIGSLEEKKNFFLTNFHCLNFESFSFFLVFFRYFISSHFSFQKVL